MGPWASYLISYDSIDPVQMYDIKNPYVIEIYMRNREIYIYRIYNMIDIIQHRETEW